MATTIVSSMPSLHEQPKVTYSTPAMPVSPSITSARRSSHPISAMLNPEPESPPYHRRISFSEVSPEHDSPSSTDSPPDTTYGPTPTELCSSPSQEADNNNNNNTGSGATVPPANPPKAKRKRITPEQLTDLVALFDQTDTPSFEVREKLAKKLGMTNREIQVWFQNRRAKHNRAKANEHNAAHNHHHHRFMHHHAGSVAHAAGAGGAPPHYGPLNSSSNNSQFHFIPMFGNSTMPQPAGFASKRADRRRSSTGFQPMAAGIPQHQAAILPSTATSNNKFTVPSPLKITSTPYNGQPAPRSAPQLSYHNPTPISSSSTPSPAHPVSPISPGSPPHSGSGYGFPSQQPNQHHSHPHSSSFQPFRPYGPHTSPPLYSPTRDFFNMSLNAKTSPPSSPAYSSTQQLPSLSSQSFYTSTAPQHRPPPPSPLINSQEPKSAIDILATAAEFVQTQERNEHETRRRASIVSYPYKLPRPHSSSSSVLPPLSASSKRTKEIISDADRDRMNRRRSLSDACKDKDRMDDVRLEGERRDWGGSWM